MNDNQVRIMYTNIRSLSRHYDELLLVLQAESVRGVEYDIIALSGTWVTTEKLKLFPIKNYMVYHAARNDGRKSCGVIFYVKNDLKIVKNEMLNIQGANSLKIEIEYSNERNSLGVNNELAMYLIYRDCTASKQRFVEGLEQIIMQNKNVKNSVFLGDMNINLLNTHESADYLNMFMSQGCLSYQNAPTRDQSCLDHVFSNINAAYINCEILPNRITDHAMISTKIEVTNTYDDRYVGEKQFTDYKKFQTLLQNANWEWVDEVEKNEKTSVKEDFDRLFATIHKCRTEGTKIKRIKNIKARRKKRQPWMTADLFLLIDKKSQAYQRYRCQKNDVKLKTDFLLISARVKKEIRKEKVRYFSKLLDNNYSDAKKYWEIINEARGKNTREGIKGIKIAEEIVTTENNPGRVAEEFNIYFLIE